MQTRAGSGAGAADRPGAATPRAAPAYAGMRRADAWKGIAACAGIAIRSGRLACRPCPVRRATTRAAGTRWAQNADGAFPLSSWHPPSWMIAPRWS